jgi:hypothetical protein
MRVAEREVIVVDEEAQALVRANAECGDGRMVRSADLDEVDRSW